MPWSIVRKKALDAPARVRATHHYRESVARRGQLAAPPCATDSSSASTAISVTWSPCGPDSENVCLADFPAFVTLMCRCAAGRIFCCGHLLQREKDAAFAGVQASCST